MWESCQWLSSLSLTHSLVLIPAGHVRKLPVTQLTLSLTHSLVPIPVGHVRKLPVTQLTLSYPLSGSNPSWACEKVASDRSLSLTHSLVPIPAGHVRKLPVTQLTLSPTLWFQSQLGMWESCQWLSSLSLTHSLVPIPAGHVRKLPVTQLTLSPTLWFQSQLGMWESCQWLSSLSLTHSLVPIPAGHVRKLPVTQLTLSYPLSGSNPSWACEKVASDSAHSLLPTLWFQSQLGMWESCQWLSSLSHPLSGSNPSWACEKVASDSVHSLSPTLWFQSQLGMWESCQWLSSLSLTHSLVPIPAGHVRKLPVTQFTLSYPLSGSNPSWACEKVASDSAHSLSPTLWFQSQLGMWESCQWLSSVSLTHSLVPIPAGHVRKLPVTQLSLSHPLSGSNPSWACEKVVSDSVQSLSPTLWFQSQLGMWESCQWLSSLSLTHSLVPIPAGHVRKLPVTQFTLSHPLSGSNPSWACEKVASDSAHSLSPTLWFQSQLGMWESCQWPLTLSHPLSGSNPSWACEKVASDSAHSLSPTLWFQSQLGMWESCQWLSSLSLTHSLVLIPAGHVRKLPVTQLTLSHPLSGSNPSWACQKVASDSVHCLSPTLWFKSQLGMWESCQWLSSLSLTHSLVLIPAGHVRKLPVTQFTLSHPLSGSNPSWACKKVASDSAHSLSPTLWFQSQLGMWESCQWLSSLSLTHSLVPIPAGHVRKLPVTQLTVSPTLWFQSQLGMWESCQWLSSLSLTHSLVPIPAGHVRKLPVTQFTVSLTLWFQSQLGMWESCQWLLTLSHPLSGSNPSWTCEKVASDSVHSLSPTLWFKSQLGMSESCQWLKVRWWFLLGTKVPPSLTTG